MKPKRDALAVVYRPIDALIPYARNARTHSDAQIAQIAGSLREFGFTNPVLVDVDGTIIAGHGRVLAARQLDMKQIPTICLAHLTEAQRRAYVLADNKLAEQAGWDKELLSLELADLSTQGFDVGLIGFSDGELRTLLRGRTEGLTDPDAAPELPAEPVSVLGDVWVLGQHRVMCGDSTSPGAVEQLMAGGKADLVFTDPPYNVAYSGRGEKNKLGPIKNDDMSDTDFAAFLRAVFASYVAAMKPLACIYVCHPDSASGPKLAFEQAFAEAFHKAATIIWVKQSAGMGWQDYRAQHEPIIYGWKNGTGKHFFCGDRSKTTVWQVDRDAQVAYVHPTQKPVALPMEAIENSSKGEDVVLDLFGGSGSTLIACEQSGRHARLMELDPRYVDVIVRRWQAFTGEAARLGGDGPRFDDVSTERLGVKP